MPHNARQAHFNACEITHARSSSAPLRLSLPERGCRHAPPLAAPPDQRPHPRSPYLRPRLQATSHSRRMHRARLFLPLLLAAALLTAASAARDLVAPAATVAPLQQHLPVAPAPQPAADLPQPAAAPLPGPHASGSNSTAGSGGLSIASVSGLQLLVPTQRTSHGHTWYFQLPEGPGAVRWGEGGRGVVNDTSALIKYVCTPPRPAAAHRSAGADRFPVGCLRRLLQPGASFSCCTAAATAPKISGRPAPPVHSAQVLPVGGCRDGGQGCVVCGITWFG